MTLPSNKWTELPRHKNWFDVGFDDHEKGLCNRLLYSSGDGISDSKENEYTRGWNHARYIAPNMHPED